MVVEVLILLASILDFLTTYIAVATFSCGVEQNALPRLLCYRNPAYLVLLIPLEAMVFIVAYSIVKRYSKRLAMIVLVVSYYAPAHNLIILLQNTH